MPLGCDPGYALDVDLGKLKMLGLGIGDAKKFKTKQKGEIDDTARVSAKGGAFIGAKATLGCKAVLEWKAKDIPREFVDLASMGFSATASVGFSLTGEFGIGYDQRHGKFLIKAKAQYALGPGFGGGLEYVVSAKHIFYFFRFVQEQLEMNNFSYLDLFETDDAIKTFQEWSWQLYATGIFIALVATPVLTTCMQAYLLVETAKRVKDWLSETNYELESAENVVKFIDDHYDICQELAPHMKARFFYILVRGKPGLVEDVFGSDLKKQQVNDALVKLFSSIGTYAEYERVMELYGEYLAKQPQLKNKKEPVILDSSCAAIAVAESDILACKSRLAQTSTDALLNSVAGWWGNEKDEKVLQDHLYWLESLPYSSH